ncbi:MAG: GNAT family N-acetyltransferase [Parvibaculaceae bacterium]|nr:GNAT family N-acetyltransferase [Parvibaculaceae bacterium]HBM87139.1 GNAT family N-acetyltransferase [Rhodobiaceae bacterium]
MKITNPDKPTAQTFADQYPDLVHQTGAATYNYLFGPDRVLFDAFMKQSWVAPQNLFSHSETTIIADGSTLLGIELGYGGSDWYKFHSSGGAVIGKLFEEGRLDEESLVALGERSNLISYMNPHIPDHAYYITALSVAASARGTGLGAKLLTNAIERARKEGYKELHLDVFSDNPAVKFYQSMGLTCMSETIAPIPCRAHNTPMEMRMVIAL